MGKVSRAAWLYIAVVCAGAAAVLSLAPAGATGARWWLELTVLRLLFLVCDSMPTDLAARQSVWSPSSSATLAAAVLLGPVGAAMTGVTAVLSLRRETMAERIFNGAMYALSGYAAGLAFRALHGHAGVPRPVYFPYLIWPFAAAALVHVVANYSLMWGVMLGLSRRQRSSSRQGKSQSSLSLLLVSDLGFASLGLVIAALWTVTGAFAAVLVLVPLVVARWAMGQFAEQQKAYKATMAALCQAVETKDYYTRGHSERVSRGAGMIAGQIGMRPERSEAIMAAGMLHDVGKLGVPTKVLRKTGPLTEEDLAAIQLHPMRGLEIVSQIGFLTEALAGIMHHHERIDGCGYPMGLAGDEIPEFARVICVADAFDSMTSTRAYREARSVENAIAELRKGAGSQFDPLFVDAFIAALGTQGWRVPGPAPRPADRQLVTAQDHDDPTAPLRVAESL